MSEHVDFKKCKYTKGSILGMECLICAGDRIRTAPIGYTVFYIREDGYGNPYDLERMEPVVNYWGHVLVRTNPLGHEITNKLATVAGHCIDIHDSINFGDGEEYEFQEVRVGEHPPYETEIVLMKISDIEIPKEDSEIFEIYYEDLTPEAQKRYLEFMKVKSAKELNMDIPGVFPISIIEH